MPDMTWGIRGHKDGLDPCVLHQFFEGRVRFGTAARLRHLGATVREQIAHRHYLDIRVILKTKRRTEFADPVPDNSHPKLTIGNGLPPLRVVRGIGSFLKALDRPARRRRQ